jgi:hypothetical protein
MLADAKSFLEINMYELVGEKVVVYLRLKLFNDTVSTACSKEDKNER